MSSIASFIGLRKSALDRLREIASLKPAPGVARHPVDDFLREHGREAAQYQCSGAVLATLLVYLQQRHGIDPMHSEYNDLARDLTKARQSTHFIFTETHKVALLTQLKPHLLSDGELRDFFNDLNDASDQQVGKPMLDGVIALQECMVQIDDQSVIVFSIG